MNMALSLARSFPRFPRTWGPVLQTSRNNEIKLESTRVAKRLLSGCIYTYGSAFEPRGSAVVAQFTFECRMQHGGCIGPIKEPKMQEKATELHQSKTHAQITVAKLSNSFKHAAASVRQMSGKCAANVRQMCSKCAANVLQNCDNSAAKV